MAVEADDLVEQFGPKAVHHRHHGDERGDAEHHGHKADRGDEEDEAFALPAGDKVALGDHPFIAGQDHRISASESSFPRRRESMNTASYEYGNPARSEEHTSELQSLMRNSYAVFCLKKKKKTNNLTHTQPVS